MTIEADLLIVGAPVWTGGTRKGQGGNRGG
jgi:hypothetical protein